MISNNFNPFIFVGSVWFLKWDHFTILKCQVMFCLLEWMSYCCIHNKSENFWKSYELSYSSFNDHGEEVLLWPDIWKWGDTWIFLGWFCLWGSSFLRMWKRGTYFRLFIVTRKRARKDKVKWGGRETDWDECHLEMLIIYISKVYQG